MSKRIVENPKVTSLKANPKNPRRITDEQRSRLHKSLEELGDLGGIIFNRRTGHLVGGHRRTEQLPIDTEIHITERFEKVTPAGTVAIGYVEAWGERFSYREVDWDEGREILAMLGANKHGGEWDQSMLPDLFLAIDSMNLDLDLTGFTFDEIAILMDPVTPVELETHTDTHHFTFSIRCRSDEEIIRIRDFFGVLQSGCDYDKFEAKCL